MEEMPKAVATSLQLSTSTLYTTICPSYSFASSSSIGAMLLHGPHHVAVKSTIAGLVPRYFISSLSMSYTSCENCSELSSIACFCAVVVFFLLSFCAPTFPHDVASAIISETAATM